MRRVDTGNVAVVAPLGTVTVAGTVPIHGLLLIKKTTTPPAGAGAVRVTVPVAILPGETVEGLRVNEDSPNGGCGVIVIVAFATIEL